MSDLILNLHNRISKNVLTTVLDKGVEDGVFIVKRYGKLAFYCSSEKTVPTAEPLSLIQVQELQQGAENTLRRLADDKRALAALAAVESDQHLTERVEGLKRTREELVCAVRELERVAVAPPPPPPLDTTALELRARTLTRSLKRVIAAIREALHESGVCSSAAEFNLWLRDSLGVVTGETRVGT